MAGWIFVAVAAGLGAGLLLWARRRRRSMRRIRDAAPGRAVNELSDGRFRVVGRVVPIRTSPSAIDESPCVFLERAVYRTVGSELVPVLRQVDHRIEAHSFYVDDGTGRVRVDPAEAVVDAITVFEDEGLLCERRLRAGEEVELVATFEPSEQESDGGPYRATALAWAAVTDVFGPPQVSYRTEPAMLVASDETTVFLRALGVVFLLISAGFGLLSGC